MTIYKVGTLLSQDTTHTEYVEADYFVTTADELNFYNRGEGKGTERKDERVAMWRAGTYSFVRSVWEPKVTSEPEGKEEEEASEPI